METILIALHLVLGAVLLWMSYRQPFPEVSRRFGILLIGIAVVLLVGQEAPNPPSLGFTLLLMTGLGGIATVIGVRHMSVTRKDVIIAPFAGVLLSVGTTGLLWIEWPNFTSMVEQIGAFILICLLTLLEIYLVFRGLLIGKLSRTWSQAGLRQMQRGLLLGEKGAISCFEKAWDVEDEHLNPMAYSALSRIHTHLGNDEDAVQWTERLAEHGGESTVAKEWLEVVDSALAACNNGSE